MNKFLLFALLGFLPFAPFLLISMARYAEAKRRRIESTRFLVAMIDAQQAQQARFYRLVEQRLQEYKDADRQQQPPQLEAKP